MGFLLVLAFFMPWIMVSCDSGYTVSSLSGMDIVRSELTSNNTSVSSDSMFYPGFFLPLAVVPVAAAATILTFLFHTQIAKLAPIIYLVAGAGALIILILKYIEFQSLISPEVSSSQGTLRVDFGIGWWLTLALLLGIAFAGVLGFGERNRAPPS